MVRRHRVEGVLCQARHLYAEYLRRHQAQLQDEENRQLEGENDRLSREEDRRRHRLAAAPSAVGDLGISV